MLPTLRKFQNFLGAWLMDPPITKLCKMQSGLLMSGSKHLKASGVLSRPIAAALLTPESEQEFDTTIPSRQRLMARLMDDVKPTACGGLTK